MLADFIECTTVSIAGAGGTGAVTCVQLSGMPYFPSVWGSAPIDVDYVIEDLATNPSVPLLEHGYGSVTTSGNTILTRTDPYETWNGTSWVESGAAPLPFGITPIFGNVRVRIAPTADNFSPSIPAMWTGGGGPFAGWCPTGNLQGPPSMSAPGLQMATGTEFYVPFRNDNRGPVAGFGFYLATAGTSGNGIKAALYGVGPNGLPGNCVTQFNALPAGTPGLITDTVPTTWGVRAGPIRLRPAWFYVGLMSNDTTAVIACTSRAATPGANPLGQLDVYGWGAVISKPAQNAYAAGLPLGTPNTLAGGYGNALAQEISVPSLFLEIGN